MCVHKMQSNYAYTLKKGNDFIWSREQIKQKSLITNSEAAAQSFSTNKS